MKLVTGRKPASSLLDLPETSIFASLFFVLSSGGSSIVFFYNRPLCEDLVVNLVVKTTTSSLEALKKES